MGKRIFYDAPAYARCHARITLKDKTHAQCGRSAIDNTWLLAPDKTRMPKLCHQHTQMVLDGRPVTMDFTGQVINGSASSGRGE
jgi:hypothetical protein